MIDFDDIDAWAPRLATALSTCVPSSVVLSLSLAAPQYVEDARARLFALAPRDAVIDAALGWIRSNTIAAYHGSRLGEEESASIHSMGLIPLAATNRRRRLERALSPHASWAAAVYRLDAELLKHGQGNAAGHREGQVHLTLSRTGLTEGFKHYLTEGAEFDLHVAYALLGQDGIDLLSRDGIPTVVRLDIPGVLALEAAHPHFSIDDTRRAGEVPNLVNQFLEAWSYRQAHPTFQSRSLKLDCGMRFTSIVPPAWIVSIEHQVNLR